MHVHTDALRAYGVGTTAMATDIAAAAVALSEMPTGTLKEALGPVGREFADAVAHATAALADNLTTLADTVIASSDASAAAARAYDDIDNLAQTRIDRIGF